jgi:hypothetical protein
MSRLIAVEAILGERHQPCADTAVPVRMAQLGGMMAMLSYQVERHGRPADPGALPLVTCF